MYSEETLLFSSPVLHAEQQLGLEMMKKDIISKLEYSSLPAEVFSGSDFYFKQFPWKSEWSSILFIFLGRLLGLTCLRVAEHNLSVGRTEYLWRD